MDIVGISSVLCQNLNYFQAQKTLYFLPSCAPTHSVIRRRSLFSLPLAEIVLCLADEWWAEPTLPLPPGSWPCSKEWGVRTIESESASATLFAGWSCDMLVPFGCAESQGLGSLVDTVFRKFYGRSE
jgi:hypothetical protein